MGYVGNIPGEKFTTINKQTLTGDGGTGYTLNQSVGSAQEIEVYVNNVRQEPGVAYTVSGTTLTMTGNVAAADSFYVIFQGKAVNTATVDDARDIRLRDSVKMFFGDGDDLQIYHSGNNSFITDAGTGDLYIRGNNSLIIQNQGGTETKATFVTNGAVHLYYDNTKRFETTSSGINVVGTAVVDNLDIGNGNNNPRIRFDDSDTSNNAEITLDNNALRIEADEDNAVANSQITFRVDSSNKAVINSSGQMSIGATSITASGTPILETTGAISVIKNHTDTASSGNVSFGAGNQGLTITNNQGGADNYTSKLGFTVATTSANSDGLIELASTNSNGSSEFRFYVESGNTLTERVRIHSSGVTSFNNGIELGSGLDATAANTLNDYEEGTFSITAARSGTTGTHGTQTRTGSYVKIGRQVFLDFSHRGSTDPYWRAGASGYASGQSFTFTSQLPFTPKHSGAVRIGWSRTLSDFDSLSIGFRANSTTIYFGVGDDNNYAPHNSATTSSGQSNVTATAQIVYFTDD